MSVQARDIFESPEDWGWRRTHLAGKLGPVCWLFHDLHDHSWRIGRIWLDFHVLHQWEWNLDCGGA